MRYPKVGVGLPIVGPFATPSSLELIAATADRLGYHSVSVYDRLLLPAHPGWRNDAGLPESPAFDGLETLTWVAAKTSRVRLRTDILVPLFQPPVVLARRVATLDHFSGGRVDLGIGLGWLPEEFAATGAPARGRARAYEESIAALRACWGPDPVVMTGEHLTIPPSRIGPKPVNGHIRLDGGGVSRPAIERAARLTDGLTLAFLNWDATLQQIEWYRDAGGTGPIVAKGGPLLDRADQPLDTTWTGDAVVDSLARAAEVGIDEFVWDLNIVGTPPEHQVERLEWLATQIH
jgi:probable F420-dependent oxidoreductase